MKLFAALIILYCSVASGYDFDVYSWNNRQCCGGEGLHVSIGYMTMPHITVNKVNITDGKINWIPDFTDSENSVKRGSLTLRAGPWMNKDISVQIYFTDTLLLKDEISTIASYAADVL